MASVFLVLFLLPAGCFAMSVSGLPDWLEPAVLRSLEAVWAEIPNAPNVDREGTLSVVALRLFAGYEVKVSRGEGEPKLHFLALEKTKWNVSLPPPELRGAALSWFQADLRGLEGEIAHLLDPLPASALTWADDALKGVLSAIFEERLPGWDFSVQVSLGASEGWMTVSFRPAPPLVLAINPSLYSRTLPVMFQSDLEAKLIPSLSPLIGLPVRWVGRHRAEVEREARAFLEDRNAVDNMRAKVDVAFIPGPISGVRARVDSDRLLFQVWVAAYAGLEERYPEAGLFLGWNTAHLTGLDLEVYAEVIAALNDLGLDHRLGLRVRLFSDFWAGGEMAWPESRWFYRLQWGPAGMRRPYLWWRWNPDLGHEAAVGYRLDKHISVEIYYDGTGSDKVGIRGMWSL